MRFIMLKEGLMDFISLLTTDNAGTANLDCDVGVDVNLVSLSIVKGL